MNAQLFIYNQKPLNIWEKLCSQNQHKILYYIYLTLSKVQTNLCRCLKCLRTQFSLFFAAKDQTNQVLYIQYCNIDCTRR